MQIHHSPLVYAAINVCFQKNKERILAADAMKATNSNDAPGHSSNCLSSKDKMLNVIPSALSEKVVEMRSPNPNETLQLVPYPSINDANITVKTTNTSWSPSHILSFAPKSASKE